MSHLWIKLNDEVYGWRQELSDDLIERRAAHKKAEKILTGVLVTLVGVGALVSLLSLFLAGDRVLSGGFWLTSSVSTVSLYGTGLLAVWLFSQVSRRPVKKTIPEGEVSQIEFTNETFADVQDFFAPDAEKAVEVAFELAQKFGHAQIEALHLFVGSMDGNEASVAFSRLGLDFDVMKEAITRRLSSREIGKPTRVGEDAQRVLLQALSSASTHRRAYITSLEVFAESYRAEPFLQELLLDSGVSETQFFSMIEWLRIHDRMVKRYQGFKKAALFKPTGPMNRAMTSVATPLLDSVSEDLTTAAVYGRLPMLIGREKEREEIFRIIEGGGQSVVLVGHEGVGKTALLEGVAQLMVEERVPKILQDKRLVRISVPHLVSGADPTLAQERLLTILSEVARSRNIILAVTDVDQLITGVGAADLAATLVDFLSRSGTFAIATTSAQAYVGSVEQSVLSRVFQKVDVAEPTQPQAIAMLQSKIGGIEQQQGVIFTYEAVERVVSLTGRYMHESYLPSKAIEIAREVALWVKTQEGEGALVNGEHVAQIVSRKTGVKAQAVEEDESAKLLGLEEKMHERIIGQEEAVSSVAAALRRARTQLRSQGRPIATFLFLGSTGVGKTELAKTVAQTYFGDEKLMVRMDMSEYQATDSVNRLLGVPGSGQGGLLTESVRKTPFSIVLLDELEKAHPNILNLFLQVFEDGRLTDAAGRTIDFTNTIIIATSNAGTAYIQEAVGRDEEVAVMRTHLIEEELQGVYRPEFLNRFDGIVVFTPLTQDHVDQITRLFMSKVAARLEPKGIGFRAEPEAVRELSKKGFDPKFGARPLRRVVQEVVDNAIATALLEGKVQRRDTIVLKTGGLIDVEKGEVL